MVCKHWLRGLCKKGDQCEFLHEYDMTKMPECYFYSKFGLYFPPVLLVIYGHLKKRLSVCILAGECSNKECPFLHIDPESKIKDCPWYDRGFCKHGKAFSVNQVPKRELLLFFLSDFNSEFKCETTHCRFISCSLVHLFKCSGVDITEEDSCLNLGISPQYPGV